MSAILQESIENAFLALPREERDVIISHGAALRLSARKKRLFLAESKIRYFHVKYQSELEQLELNGLPDDASREMHEDYIMWHHWDEAASKLRKEIADLEAITEKGLYLGQLSYAGD